MQRALAVLPCPRVMVANEFLTMCAAAKAGVGAIATTSVQAKLRGLVAVPAPFPAVPPSSFLVVTHQALRHVPRVVAVLEELERLVEELGLAHQVKPRVSRSPSARRGTTSPSPP